MTRKEITLTTSTQRTLFFHVQQSKQRAFFWPQGAYFNKSSNSTTILSSGGFGFLGGICEFLGQLRDFGGLEGLGMDSRDSGGLEGLGDFRELGGIGGLHTLEARVPLLTWVKKLNTFYTWAIWAN